MSQIATAYVVEASALPAIAGAAGGDRFWDTLWDLASEVLPGYDYSGVFVTTAQCYLEERVALADFETTNEVVKSLPVHYYPIPAIDSANTRAALTAIREHQPSEDELRRYFVEFNELDWPDAGKAMSEAIEFICRGLEQATEANALLLVFVG